MNRAEMRRLNRKIADDLASEYVPADVALTTTGISSLERLLTWCTEKNIRHIKRKRRWLFHQCDLLQHLRQA